VFYSDLILPPCLAQNGRLFQAEKISALKAALSRLPPTPTSELVVAGILKNVVSRAVVRATVRKNKRSANVTVVAEETGVENNGCNGINRANGDGDDDTSSDTDTFSDTDASSDADASSDDDSSSDTDASSDADASSKADVADISNINNDLGVALSPMITTHKVLYFFSRMDGMTEEEIQSYSGPESTKENPHVLIPDQADIEDSDEPVDEEPDKSREQVSMDRVLLLRPFFCDIGRLRLRMYPLAGVCI
jgi:hypothetical protein